MQNTVLHGACSLGLIRCSYIEGGACLKIMFSAGEVSGDLHGAGLAMEIRAIAPDIELMGFGGEQMERAGVRLIRDFASYNIMGVLEVIKNLRRIFQLLDVLTEAMEKERPQLLVLIDYPDFNWRLAKRARKLGIPVFSYIPPSAWAWRKGRAKACAAIANEFLAIFPFETKVYEEAGANISFVGNPLVDKVKPELDGAAAREHFHIGHGDHVVLLLPGSRKQEIRMLLPVMLEAAKLLMEKKPGTRFFLPVASGIDREQLASEISRVGVPVEMTEEYRYSLMSIADAAIATSGTVVMEAALLGLPCVVVYRMARLNYMIGRLLVHVEHISLPNLLLEKRVQPELLQDEVEPIRIVEEIQKLYVGEPERERVVEDLKSASAKLGAPGASRRAAEKILAAAVRYSPSVPLRSET